MTSEGTAASRASGPKRALAWLWGTSTYLERVLLLLLVTTLFLAAFARPTLALVWPQFEVSLASPFDPNAIEHGTWDRVSGEIREQPSRGGLPPGTRGLEGSGQIEALFDVYPMALGDPYHPLPHPPHGHPNVSWGGYHVSDPPPVGVFSLLAFPRQQGFDPWDQPWRYREVQPEPQSPAMGKGVTDCCVFEQYERRRVWRIYSSGPDRTDQRGQGDDIEVVPWDPQVRALLELTTPALWAMALALAWFWVAIRALRCPRTPGLLRELWLAGVAASPACVACAIVCYLNRPELADLVPKGLSQVSPAISVSLTGSAILVGIAVFWRTRRPEVDDQGAQARPLAESLVLLLVGLVAVPLLAAWPTLRERAQVARDLEAAKAGSLAAAHRLRDFPEALAKVAAMPEGPPSSVDFGISIVADSEYARTLKALGEPAQILRVWAFADRPGQPLLHDPATYGVFGYGSELHEADPAFLRAWAEAVASHPTRFRAAALSHPALLTALLGSTRTKEVVQVLLQDSTLAFARYYGPSGKALALSVRELAALRFAPLLLPRAERPSPPPPGDGGGLILERKYGEIPERGTPPPEVVSRWDAFVKLTAGRLKESKWRPAWLLVRPEKSTYDKNWLLEAGEVQVTWPRWSGRSREEFGDWVALGPLTPGEVEFKIRRKPNRESAIMRRMAHLRGRPSRPKAQDLDPTGASRERLEPDRTIWLEADREGEAFLIRPWQAPAKAQ